MHGRSVAQALVLTVLCVTVIQARVTTYTMPQQAIDNGLSSTLFTVKVNGTSIPVYRGPNTAQNNCFAYFDFGNETVTVEVTRQAADWGPGAVIRPKSKGIAFTRSGRSLTFSLTAPANITVETTGRVEDDLLMLFANPLVSAAEKTAARTFGPGYHTVMGTVSATSIYIDGGAVLEGADLQADTIRGRGITVNDLRPNTGASDWKSNMVRSANLSGIIQLKNDQYGFWGAQQWLHGFTVDNFHIVSDGGTDDGMDLCAIPGNGVVRNSFIRTMDDCIAIKVLPWFDYMHDQPCHGITIDNCVLFSDEWGSGVTIGVESSADIYGINVSNCDVIHALGGTYARGGLTIIRCGEGEIRDIVYDNCRLEDCQVAMALYDDLSYADKLGVPVAKVGNVRNITFRNIAVDTSDNWFYALGCTYNNVVSTIGGVNIENCTRGASPIRDAYDLRVLFLDEHFRDFSFAGGPVYNPGVNVRMCKPSSTPFTASTAKTHVDWDIDTRFCAETDVGGYVEFAVDVPSAGRYGVFAQTGGGWQRMYGGKVQLQVNGTPVGGLWDVSDLGPAKADFGTVALPKGPAKFRFVAATKSGTNNQAWVILDWFEIVQTAPATSAAPTPLSVRRTINHTAPLAPSLIDLRGRSTPARGEVATGLYTRGGGVCVRAPFVSNTRVDR